MNDSSMDLQRFCVKFFARPAVEVDDHAFIEIFHEWIRRKRLPGILIDVADYRHVHHGPGVMLIGHEANLAMDRAAGRLGLLYQRKTAQAGAPSQRILAAVEAARRACRYLEQEPRLGGRLLFDDDTFEFSANDRLLAPNEPTAATAVSVALAAVASNLYRQGFAVEQIPGGPGERLRIRVASAGMDAAAVVGGAG